MGRQPCNIRHAQLAKFIIAPLGVTGSSASPLNTVPAQRYQRSNEAAGRYGPWEPHHHMLAPSEKGLAYQTYHSADVSLMHFFRRNPSSILHTGYKVTSCVSFFLPFRGRDWVPSCPMQGWRQCYRKVMPRRRGRASTKLHLWLFSSSRTTFWCPVVHFHGAAPNTSQPWPLALNLLEGGPQRPAMLCPIQ